MEYIITVVRTSLRNQKGEFVFSTKLSNRKETKQVYDMLRAYLPCYYVLYVDRWKKVGTDVTNEFQM